ncbi:MAG TPA: ABC transporter ATP-binding protein [Candidatus Dormibacteraeota bacterium]|nr:ABC transporter ATP-binding protein [Candidatus Dormibacteraeota bacterium]
MQLTSGTAGLVAEAVNLTYGEADSMVQALNAVSLSLEPGAFVALLGPSGSGKTSLLHCLGGLVAPTSGQVRWDGRPLGGPDTLIRIGARGADFAYVFQGGNLLPTFTAAENIAFAALVGGGRNSLDAVRLLAEVGLEGKADSLPDELSGGEQQRVAVARALAQGARVLLADEPTGQLDSSTAAIVLDLIDHVRAENPQLIVVLATHDAKVAARAERRLSMLDGRLESNKTPSS